MRRLSALGAGGRRGVFFHRCVGVGFVEAEDEKCAAKPCVLGDGKLKEVSDDGSARTLPH